MSDERHRLPPREDPGRATAESGVVILDGPDGVAVTMMPDAADRAGDSLHEAAQRAREDEASRSDQADRAWD